jgi:serine/threonine protein phosphatase PrpC
VIGYETIEYASLTDVGVRRSHNQDAHATLLATDPEQWQARGHIFLVADGMGAHAVGELASELAVGIIPHTYYKHAVQAGVSALRKAFVEANASIHAKGQQNPEFGGMGTTTTALLIRPEGAWIGHVGDSRAYRVREGEIDQLSFDHSLVWEMARRQGVDPDSLEGIPSNVIVRSLGPEPLVQVDLEGPHPIRPGDIFLLCSDGLSGQVTDTEMGVIAGALPPAEACRFLVDLANLRGGPDNITILIARINEASDEKKAAPPNRPPWYRRIPWPFWALGVSFFLAVAAMAFNYYEIGDRGKLAILLSAASSAVGLVGLVFIYRKEKERLAKEPAYAPARTYRQADCKIEPELVHQIGQSIGELAQQVREKQLEIDWDTFEGIQGQAGRLLQEGKSTEAIRESSHALRFLTEAVGRQRPRGEVFQPVWDKKN